MNQAAEAINRALWPQHNSLYYELLMRRHLRQRYDQSSAESIQPSPLLYPTGKRDSAYLYDKFSSPYFSFPLKWKATSSEGDCEVQSNRRSGGLSNSLYRCSIPENVVVKNPKTPRQVLLRIYGPFQENMNVVLTEVTTFIFLAERKLGPKLYGVFPKGRLEEFIPSRTLLNKDYRLMHRAIAREMAKIHALDVPVRKIPDFWLVKIKKYVFKNTICLINVLY
ncbi:Choline/ethanolamine kinase [Araneus ventricosus]|uniref:Choline/ethanolamine kinase n=1 Tax=Araneus ventricosus TaxID=182803 RepID=A0A4Y2PEU0_ARAVE|nr:Choline/ethanolamine kinase [Araneus ventricosus]